MSRTPFLRLICMGESLWGSINLGEWSAEELFALHQKRLALQLPEADFGRLQSLRDRQRRSRAKQKPSAKKGDAKTALPLTDAESDELARLDAFDRSAELPRAEADRYARLLMHLTTARFRNHDFFVSLPKRGMEPAEVAAAVLATLIRRTKRMRLRHPCHRTLLENIHQLIRCAVLDQIRRQTKNTICASDYASEQVKSAGDPLDRGFAAPALSPDLAAVESRLRGLEEEIISDVVAAPEAASRAFRVNVVALVYGAPIAHDELPGIGRLSEDAWALIRLRIVRAILGTLGEARAPQWVERLPPTARMRWLLLYELIGDATPAVAYLAAAALGGEQIRLPTLDDVNSAERQKMILSALGRDPSTEAVGRLASVFGTSKREVSRLFTIVTGHGLAEARRFAR
jgi:hypothetical protein